MPAERRLRILTWNVHGNYLHALAHVPHEWLVPVAGMRPGYTPPTPELDWPAHVRVVDPGQLRDETLDLIVYQSRDNLADAPQLLRPAQLALPSLYVEHNPPEPHPTDSWHPFRHPRGLLLHVTHHNAQMWQAPGMPARVIEHGVPDPGRVAAGAREGGITVINHLARRGRRLGLDLYQRAHARLALDLIGMARASCPAVWEKSPTARCRPSWRATAICFHPCAMPASAFRWCRPCCAACPWSALPPPNWPA